MSLKIKPIAPIPADTYTLAVKLYAPTNPYLVIGNRLALFVSDGDFADLYSVEGKPALSPALLAMVTTLQYMENLSDREAAVMVVSRIDWKYALHLPLDYAGFDFSVLCEFRGRLVEHEATGRVFEALLEQLKADGLVSGRGKQRTDALAVVGAVRRLNRLELVVETVRVTLNAIEDVDAEWLKRNVPASWAERYAQPAHGERLVKERGEKGRAAANALAQQVGQDGVWLLGRIDAADTPTLIRDLPQVKTLRTVWVQQFKVEEGAAVIFKESLDDVSGLEQIQTPHDPDVRYSEKRGHDWEGYKVHITETVDEDQPRLITDVQTSLACEADSAQVKPIQTALVERDLTPNQHIGDAGYITGATMRDSQEERSIELIGPARPDTSAQARSGGVTLDQFEIDTEQKVARCPGGHASAGWTEGQDQSGETVYHIEFDAETCAGCPLREQCIKSKRNKGRKLQVKASHRYVAQRRKEQSTPEFKAVYQKRAGVEASLSEMVRAHGLRAARYVGQAKVHLQHLFIATATNLKRSARWLAGARPAKNRPPGLRSLVPAIG